MATGCTIHHRAENSSKLRRSRGHLQPERLMPCRYAFLTLVLMTVAWLKVREYVLRTRPRGRQVALTADTTGFSKLKIGHANLRSVAKPRVKRLRYAEECSGKTFVMQDIHRSICVRITRRDLWFLHGLAMKRPACAYDGKKNRHSPYNIEPRFFDF